MKNPLLPSFGGRSKYKNLILSCDKDPPLGLAGAFSPCIVFAVALSVYASRPLPLASPVVLDWRALARVSQGVQVELVLLVTFLGQRRSHAPS